MEILRKKGKLLAVVLVGSMCSCAHNQSMFAASQLPNFANTKQSTRWAAQLLSRIQPKRVSVGEQGVVDCQLLPLGPIIKSQNVSDGAKVLLSSYYYTTSSTGSKLFGNGYSCENIILAARADECTLSVWFAQSGVGAAAPAVADQLNYQFPFSPSSQIIGQLIPNVVRYHNRPVDWVRLGYKCKK